MVGKARAAWQRMAGTARLGMARLGLARQGGAWRGEAGRAGQGVARRGPARRGAVGLARHGRHGKVLRGTQLTAPTVASKIELEI